MAMPSGDILALRLGGAVPSDSWSIGFWFVITGLTTTPSPSAMNSAALGALNGFNNLFWNAATNPWKAEVSSGTTLASSTCYLYRGGTLTASGTGAITAVPGTGSGANPQYTARCVTLQTNSPGRSRRGRVYLPETATSVNATSGLWLSRSAALANLASFFSTSAGTQSAGYFFGTGETADFVVVSTTHTYTTSITGLRMDNKPDTQHGRESKLVATVFDTATIP